MPGLDAAGPVAAYARGCLAAARADRDWFRAAVTRLEVAGGRVVQTEQPSKDGDAGVIRDWRTGAALATITGVQDDYEAAWRDSWTDVCWIGAWLEDLAGNAGQRLDWPEVLPPPPRRDPAPPLAVPLPGSLAGLLEETVEGWVVAAGVTAARAAEVAELTGWTEDEVLACTVSWLTITGEQYMRLGAIGQGPEPQVDRARQALTTEHRKDRW